MEMSLGDFFDRWTVLLLKAQAGADSGELAAYEAELGAMLRDSRSVASWRALVQLAQANAIGWELEAQLAQAKGNLEAVGKLALRIRDNNNQRVKAKGLINELGNPL